MSKLATKVDSLQIKPEPSVTTEEHPNQDPRLTTSSGDPIDLSTSCKLTAPDSSTTQPGTEHPVEAMDTDDEDEVRPVIPPIRLSVKRPFESDDDVLSSIKVARTESYMADCEDEDEDDEE